MSALEWDETQFPRKVWGKSIDTSFLASMESPNGWCEAEYFDGWRRIHYCDRAAGHTGRHLATEHLFRYPVAVWR